MSFGQRPSSSTAARCAAIQAQVATAVGVLEQQRQRKLGLLAAAEAKAAEVLAAGAGVTLRLCPQMSVNRWLPRLRQTWRLRRCWRTGGIEVAGEARRRQAALGGPGISPQDVEQP